jgi:hypothetical protein
MGGFLAKKQHLSSQLESQIQSKEKNRAFWRVAHNHSEASRSELFSSQ